MAIAGGREGRGHSKAPLSPRAGTVLGPRFCPAPRPVLPRWQSSQGARGPWRTVGPFGPSGARKTGETPQQAASHCSGGGVGWTWHPGPGSCFEAPPGTLATGQTRRPAGALRHAQRSHPPGFPRFLLLTACLKTPGRPVGCIRNTCARVVSGDGLEALGKPPSLTTRVDARVLKVLWPQVWLVRLPVVKHTGSRAGLASGFASILGPRKERASERPLEVTEICSHANPEARSSSKAWQGQPPSGGSSPPLPAPRSPLRGSSHWT